MKKLFFIAILLLGCANVNAGVVVHTTCGKDVMTVSEEEFGDGYAEYLLDLNEMHCGVRRQPFIERT